MVAETRHENILLPVVASISYEMLMGMAKRKRLISQNSSLAGLQVQRLTTKEPDDEW